MIRLYGRVSFVLELNIMAMTIRDEINDKNPLLALRICRMANCDFVTCAILLETASGNRRLYLSFLKSLNKCEKNTIYRLCVTTKVVYF